MAYNNFIIDTLTMTIPTIIPYVHFYTAYVFMKGKQELKEVTQIS